ncbi:MAG: helix-turn-helix domain-containing protein [Thermoanaerobaculia bacterium]
MNENGKGPSTDRRGRGRPRIELTDEQRNDIRKMARAGHTASEIAEDMGVSVRTLRRNFGSPLRSGQKSCSRMLRSELVDRAMDRDSPGSIQALLLACKTIAGLREGEPTQDELDREPKFRGLIIRPHCPSCGHDPRQGAIIVVGDDDEKKPDDDDENQDDYVSFPRPGGGDPSAN